MNSIEYSNPTQSFRFFYEGKLQKGIFSVWIYWSLTTNGALLPKI